MLDREVTHALHEISNRLGRTREIDEILHTIAVATRLSLAEVDQVGISLVHGDGRIETRAATGDLVVALDELQYEFNEGPCLDAMDPGVESDVVRVDSARHEQRWPRFIPSALKLGLRSQLGIRIFIDGKTIGGLNMYSTTADTISVESEGLAELFATQAALALGRMRTESNLMHALETRSVIGQATGIVMERYRLNAERAFEYLIRISQARNIKLHSVAVSLVAEFSAPPESDQLEKLSD